ncbi:hypothetical protein Sste5346_005411 [Sporothrix stenoceras]|uniref:Hydrophobin n=1 Tax=Sporothrix stenoceras TaxID=5173 RepID=A0ABR3Z6V0_9PEZI
MHFSIPAILAALSATAMAGAGSPGYGPCGPSRAPYKPYCCPQSSDPVIFEGCELPSAFPTSLLDFKSICSENEPKCCTIQDTNPPIAFCLDPLSE